MKYQCAATTAKGLPCKVFVDTVVLEAGVWYCGSHYRKWERKGGTK